MLYYFIVRIIINNQDDLIKISGDWLRLAKKIKAPPFLYPGWLLPWWKYFGEGKLISYAVYDNKELKFLAPLFIRKLKQEKEEKVVFIGTGNSDYLDVISSPEDAQLYIQELWEYLYSIKGEYDLIDLQEIKHNSFLLSCSIPECFSIDKKEGDVCHVVALPPEYNEFLKRFSRKRVKNLFRMEKKLKESGGFHLEIAGTDDVENFIKASAELNRKRWSRFGSDGVLSDNKVIDFNIDAVINLIEHSNAHLLRLRNGKNVIAVEYLLSRDCTAYDYIHSNNPDYEYYSPGLLMRLNTVRYLISRGIKYFDFLRGDEEYKNDWGASVERNYRLVLTPK